MTIGLQFDPASGYLLFHSETDVRPGAEPGTLMLDCCCGAECECNNCDPGLKEQYSVSVNVPTDSPYAFLNGTYPVTCTHTVPLGCEWKGPFPDIPNQLYNFKVTLRWQYDGQPILGSPGKWKVYIGSTSSTASPIAHWTGSTEPCTVTGVYGGRDWYDRFPTGSTAVVS